MMIEHLNVETFKQKMVSPILKELASIFGIQSIPSLLFIPSDEQPQMAVGALTGDTFVKAFREVLHVE